MNLGSVTIAVMALLILGGCVADRQVPYRHAVGWRRDKHHSPEDIIAGEGVARAYGPDIYELPDLGVNLVTWKTFLTPNHPKMRSQIWLDYWDGSSWRRIDYSPVPDGVAMRTLVELPPDLDRLYLTVRSPTCKVESLALETTRARDRSGVPNEKLLPTEMTCDQGIAAEPGFQGWTRLYRGIRLCQSFVAEHEAVDGVTMKYQFQKEVEVTLRLRAGSSAGDVVAESKRRLPPTPEWKSVHVPLAARGLDPGGEYVLEVLASGPEGRAFVKIGERYDNPYRHGFVFELLDEDATSFTRAFYAARYMGTQDLDIILHHGDGTSLDLGRADSMDVIDQLP